MIGNRGSKDSRTRRIVKLIKYLCEHGPKTKEEIISEFYERKYKGIKHESLVRRWYADKDLLEKEGILRSQGGFYFVFTKTNLEVDLELWWAGRLRLGNEKLTESLNRLKNVAKERGILPVKVIPQLIRWMGHVDNEENRKVVYEWVKRKGITIV